ncbi:hypothetical protein FHS27_004041 [Rhodopirellula rubra]|uniref:Uncharacterized protein n=1 Tax=Aporhodopirellula rubra TaxID=980271 RepID=A0A7W5E100_9BACT|nr:hypothetical protein [Aporhodopirellula rubra]MBB3208214.1 hypothetical protein [Aporhodopirellula rubra]
MKHGNVGDDAPHAADAMPARLTRLDSWFDEDSLVETAVNLRRRG